MYTILEEDSTTMYYLSKEKQSSGGRKEMWTFKANVTTHFGEKHLKNFLWNKEKKSYYFF